MGPDWSGWLGQSRPKRAVRAMSVVPPVATGLRILPEVRFVPRGDLRLGPRLVESLSGRFLEAETYYSIRAATDRRVSPEPFHARADELSRVEA
jgi:hypothetical protein